MKSSEIGLKREEGLRRFALIASLTDEKISPCEKRQRKTFILQDENISERTLRRWIGAYKEGGFDALVPKERKDKGISKAISADAMALAETCRKELPRRSAEVIRTHLKSSGFDVALSTLERQLRERGLSGKEIMRHEGQNGTRRFNRVGRNTLWQADIKYGPYIPDPKNPIKKIRTYLMVILDDATRMVVHGEFYDNQKLPILENALRQAILRCGVPKTFYCDNGKIFISNWMQLACAKMGIKHLKTQAYSPESKGKVERFNRTVGSFIDEVQLESPQNIDELNHHFRAWLSESYHHKHHKGLGGATPAATFAKDTSPIRFSNLETLREAFLWECKRRVDKSGVLSLNGKNYEAGIDYLRKTVLLKYDPFNISEIELWEGNEKKKTLRELSIQEFNCKNHAPAGQPKGPGYSRVLKVLQEEHKKRFKQKLGAFQMGVKSDV